VLHHHYLQLEVAILDPLKLVFENKEKIHRLDNLLIYKNKIIKEII
jgi:hypothetical protein